MGSFVSSVGLPVVLDDSYCTWEMTRSKDDGSLCESETMLKPIAPENWIDNTTVVAQPELNAQEYNFPELDPECVCLWLLKARISPSFAGYALRVSQSSCDHGKSCKNDMHPG